MEHATDTRGLEPSAGRENNNEMGVGMYSSGVAARIARISPQKFHAWANDNLVHPAKIRVGGKTEKTFSYYDLLLIRLILKLRERGFRPQKIKKALETITKMSTGSHHAWMKAKIYVDNDLIVAQVPGNSEPDPIFESDEPQAMALISSPGLIEELEAELVPPDKFPHIEINPDIMGGAPIIRGTRIPTQAIAAAKGSGQDPRVLYPSISEQEAAEAESYEKFLENA